MFFYSYRLGEFERSKIRKEKIGLNLHEFWYGLWFLTEMPTRAPKS